MRPGEQKDTIILEGEDDQVIARAALMLAGKFSVAETLLGGSGSDFVGVAAQSQPGHYELSKSDSIELGGALLLYIARTHFTRYYPPTAEARSRIFQLIEGFNDDAE